MFFAGQDKNVMSNRSLSQAIALYKTAANLARTLGIDPDLIYKWHNQDIRMPLPMALRIEDVTNIDFERLSPHTPEANFLIKNRSHRKSLITIETQDILLDGSQSLRKLPSDRPMIIGEDRVLISGLDRLEAEKLRGAKHLKVLVIDLESLFLGIKSIHEFPYLSISEKIEIGLRLEGFMGHPPGAGHDLKSNVDPKINKNTSEPIPIWGVFTGRKDIFIAKILGYSTNTYYRARQVYLHGIPELIQAMDLKKVRINKAYTLSKLNEIEQSNWIQSYLKEAPVS